MKTDLIGKQLVGVFIMEIKAMKKVWESGDPISVKRIRHISEALGEPTLAFCMERTDNEWSKIPQEIREANYAINSASGSLTYLADILPEEGDEWTSVYTDDEVMDCLNSAIDLLTSGITTISLPLSVHFSETFGLARPGPASEAKYARRFCELTASE
jgi:hypothetical protein